MYMTFVAKSLSYLNVLLSSRAMAKIIFCFCGYKGAVEELESERNIEQTDVVKTAPVSVTAVKEDRDKALPFPITKSDSMETITSTNSVPASADAVSNSSSLMSAKEELEENIVQNQ